MKKRITDCKEHRKRWVQALRSGEYNQGTNGLHHLENGYCCLGVLCAVAGIESTQSDDGWVEYGAYRERGLAPDEALAWSGLVNRDGAFYNGQYSLVVLNDHGATFDEIADVIESEPPELFQGDEE